MKKIVSFALAAVASTAIAGDYKINVESRVDFDMKSKEFTGKAQPTAFEKSNNFQLQLLRLNLFGNVNDSLSYRIRYRFNDVTNPTTTARAGSTNNLDYVYVDHKNSLFTLRVGKQNWAEAYGRESFFPSSDIILPTEAYVQYNAHIGGDGHEVKCRLLIT